MFGELVFVFGICQYVYNMLFGYIQYVFYFGSKISGFCVGVDVGVIFLEIMVNYGQVFVVKMCVRIFIGQFKKFFYVLWYGKEGGVEIKMIVFQFKLGQFFVGVGLSFVYGYFMFLYCQVYSIGQVSNFRINNCDL